MFCGEIVNRKNKCCSRQDQYTPPVQGRATINDRKIYLWSIAIYLYLYYKKLLRTHAVYEYDFVWFWFLVVVYKIMKRLLYRITVELSHTYHSNFDLYNTLICLWLGCFKMNDSEFVDIFCSDILKYIFPNFKSTMMQVCEKMNDEKYRR